MTTSYQPKAPVSGLIQTVRAFARDEHGAITVDWVVLTAALIGLSLGLVAMMQAGLVSSVGQIESSLASAIVIDIGLLN